MVILSAPRILESTLRIKVNPEIFTDINRQFLPMLRYHNPKVEMGMLPVDSTNSATLSFHDDSEKSLQSTAHSFSSVMQWVLDSDREKSVDILSKRQTSDR